MSLLEALRAAPYQGYCYGYPHKTAYRALEPAPTLAQVWQGEPTDSLTLYVHVPFCEMRCGFCNLFTLRGGSGGLEQQYLDALERQAEQVLGAIDRPRFSAIVIGGGTPTQLSVNGLARLLRLCRSWAGHEAPLAIETSPRTADDARLELLREVGARRLSLGVQSFDDQETRALGRPQQRSWVEAALQRIRGRGFAVLNLDLIYGAEGQTEASLLGSLRAALSYEPEELYLYPLYVRPLTGLAPRGLPRIDARLGLYRAARGFLLEHGYEQLSMRFFRRRGVPGGVDTCCQEEGTVGLGCGARSYTRSVHHAFEWAVGQQAIAARVREFIAASSAQLGRAHHGFTLSPAEQRRRYVLKTLLRVDGVPLARYRAFFGSAALEDLPELQQLVGAGLAEHAEGALRLTAAGLELSDAIGPHLYSPTVRQRMASHELC